VKLSPDEKSFSIIVRTTARYVVRVMMISASTSFCTVKLRTGWFVPAGCFGAGLHHDDAGLWNRDGHAFLLQPLAPRLRASAAYFSAIAFSAIGGYSYTTSSAKATHFSFGAPGLSPLQHRIAWSSRPY